MAKQSHELSNKGGRRLRRAMAAAVCMSALIGSYANAQTWGVSNTTNSQGNPAINISYGSPQTGYPECAEFDMSSSYFRLSPDSSTAWASSIILNPAYWSNNVYNQAGTLTMQSHSVVNGNLVLNFTGIIGSLSTTSVVTIHPPTTSTTGTNGVSSIQADVKVAVTGSVVLDPRPGEAFKVVTLSSMHDSDTIWDNQYIQSGSSSKFTYPPTGVIGNGNGAWAIADGVLSANNFLLQGGISSWQTQSSGGRAAPTISVKLDKTRHILARETFENDPNGDNIQAWAASDNDGETVQPNWTYTVKVLRNYTVTE